MPAIDFVVSSPIAETFRVAQIKGMFDLPLKGTVEHRWQVSLPIEENDWNVGLIVGPSGSGKTTIARAMFGGHVHDHFEWPRDRAMVDGFPAEASIQEVVESLSSVGLSSPPSWCKPFHVLSNGEQFRAELARALLEYASSPMFVIDEFTSVVDRTVAKVGSNAVARAVRKKGARMVALSCHYDIVDWVEPDWVLDLKTNAFVRRRLRRPRLELELRGVGREAWHVFAKHHYLSGAMHGSAECYGCFWGKEIVAFGATLPTFGYKGRRRVHRIVVFPDYQGVGVGRAMLRMMGGHYAGRGLRLSITSSHPAIVKGLKRDRSWREV